MTWMIPVENLSILQGLQTTNKNLKTTLYLYGETMKKGRETWIFNRTEVYKIPPGAPLAFPTCFFTWGKA